MFCRPLYDDIIHTLGSCSGSAVFNNPSTLSHSLSAAQFRPRCQHDAFLSCDFALFNIAFYLTKSIKNSQTDFTQSILNLSNFHQNSDQRTTFRSRWAARCIWKIDDYMTLNWEIWDSFQFNFMGVFLHWFFSGLGETYQRRRFFAIDHASVEFWSIGDNKAKERVNALTECYEDLGLLQRTEGYWI